MIRPRHLILVVAMVTALLVGYFGTFWDATYHPPRYTTGGTP